MAFLETVVFSDVVKVIATDNNGSLHLSLDDDASQDATSNRDISGEGALLIDVVALNGLEQELRIRNGPVNGT